MYYAKSSKKDPQELENHLIGVALKALELINKYEFGKNHPKYKDIQDILIISSLIHDIGKITQGFQKNLKNNEEKEEDNRINKNEKFIGPYHNEVSWFLFKKLFNDPFLKPILDNSSKSNNVLDISYLLYWHHSANISRKEGDIVFNFSDSNSIHEKLENEGEDVGFILDESKKIIYRVIDRFYKITQIKVNLTEKNYYIDNYKTPEYNYLPKKDLDLGDEALKKSLLAILIEADIIISKIGTNKELVDYINQYKINKNEIIPTVSKPPRINSKRTESQVSFSNKIKQYQLVSCGLDTGIGKTAISILSTNHNKTNIILPKIKQVDELNISKSYKELYGEECELKISRIHSGSLDNIEDKYNFRISVFDQIFSCLFDRRKLQVFLDLLDSDLIIDEYHEFVSVPTMIIPLKTMLEIRRLLPSTVKTILMSGTPDPVLWSLLIKNCNNINKVASFGRGSIEPLDSFIDDKKKTKIKIGIKEEIENDKLNSTLISTNSIKSSQTVYKNLEKFNPMLCHSYFIDEDLESILEEIKNKFHGKESSREGLVINPLMLSSSYDFSFQNLYKYSCIPQIDVQFCGRVNRDYSYEDASYNFIIEKSVPMFVSKTLGMTLTHKNWNNFLIKNFSEEDKFLTHREFGLIYDSFFENKEYISDYSNELINSIIESYKDIYQSFIPIKGLGAIIKKVNTENISVKKNSRVQGFRGKNNFISCLLVNDLNRELTFDQITGVDCLSIDSFNYKSEDMNDITKLYNSLYNEKSDKLKEDYYPLMTKKYSRYFGYSSECPFVVSFNDINIEDLKSLFNTENIIRFNETEEYLKSFISNVSGDNLLSQVIGSKRENLVKSIIIYSKKFGPISLLDYLNLLRS